MDPLAWAEFLGEAAMRSCEHCGHHGVWPHTPCPGCGRVPPPRTSEITSSLPPDRRASRPHARLDVAARYEFAAVPRHDPPVMGVLLEIRAEGRAIVDPRAGPVAHVILALDVSASMDAPDKLPAVLRALRSMLDDLRQPRAAEVLISVVIFSQGADAVLQAVPARKIDHRDLFHRIRHHSLAGGRYTDLGGAVKWAGVIAARQCRTAVTVPTSIHLLTDGRPQDLDRAREVASKVGTIPADLNALAFGDDADVALLQELFAGRRGGTVKVVRPITVAGAFGRVAEAAQNVVATRCRVWIELAPGVAGGRVFRFRPARVRYPEPCFERGKLFATDLGTIESDRTYGLLLEVRLPEREEPRTDVGTVRVEIPSFGGPIVGAARLVVPRSSGATPTGLEREVRAARDILEAVDETDPTATLRSLELRRELYERERRDPGLLTLLDRAIRTVRTTGTLDGLSSGDRATLRAHTCTAESEDWEKILSDVV